MTVSITTKTNSPSSVKAVRAGGPFTVRKVAKTSPLSKSAGIRLSPKPPQQSVAPRLQPLQARNTSSPRPIQPTTPTPKTAAGPTVVPQTPAPRGIWYLGGNHIIKLLTSVDGDFDPSVLSKLTEVPEVIGELALSVESLVSDDLTVGGFESDLLARIANNTLAAKQSMSVPSTGQSVPAVVPEASGAPADASTDMPPPSTKTTAPTSTSTAAVPDPLSDDYKPVPNPLARITPPGSPLRFNSNHQSTVSSPGAKRPEASSTTRGVASQAQQTMNRTTPTPMIVSH